MFSNTLKSVELHITDLCTHFCPYCYMDAHVSMNPNHADFETLCKMIDEIIKSKVEIIALLGGDPVLHPDIINILEYIKKKNREIKVVLMSNTMQIVDAEPQYISTLIDGIDTTIHGRNAKEHDSFCKRTGAYDLLLDNLQVYSDLGIKINIAINLIPDTFDKIYDIVSVILCRGINIDTLLTQRILPYGRAENSDRYEITGEQLNIAFGEIKRAEEDFNISISVEDPYPLCCLDKEFWKYMKGCPEGICRMPIDCKGNVSKCGAVTDYTQGNILQTSLLNVWENSKAFKSFRDNSHITLDECKICEYKTICRGGCPVDCELCNSMGISYIEKYQKKQE